MVGSGRSCSCLPLLKALPAKNRSALRGFERNSSFTLAPGADCLGFHPLIVSAGLRQTQRRRAFGFAILTPLRLILELLVVKEQLLAGCEDEISAAIHALQTLILELHVSAPFRITPGDQRVFGHMCILPAVIPTLGFGPCAGLLRRKLAK